MSFAKSFAAISLAAAISVATSIASAEDGVKKDEILFGQVAALEGPAAALGTGMQIGIKAAFEEANRAGGVHNRKLELYSVNDGYEPGRSIAKTEDLISRKKVFALIGPVGTPTTRATQPIASRNHVPFIGPFTGAGFLRDASLGNIVNFRASYDAETESWIKYLVDQKKLKRIAILYQDDAFGRVGLIGVEKALATRGMKLIAKGTYRRNTTAVKVSLLDLRKAKPDAVVMVGAYKPIAEFVRTAKSIKFSPEFVTISFVGSAALASDLGADGKDVVISQVVPDPWDQSLPVVKQYTKALNAVDENAKPDFVSLEGYLVGRLTVEALAKAGPDLTRTGFLNAVWNTGSFDLGGVALSFGPQDNQGSDNVYLTRISADGSFKTVEMLGY